MNVLSDLQDVIVFMVCLCNGKATTVTSGIFSNLNLTNDDVRPSVKMLSLLSYVALIASENYPASTLTSAFKTSSALNQISTEP